MGLESVKSERRLCWYRNPDIMFPLLLVILGILFFADPLFSSKNFYFRDVLNFHLPLRKVMIDSYAHGVFPLWNPRVYLGQLMLANPNYMALYPTVLLNLVFPFAYAFKLHLIVHALLAGTGIFFLQRQMGITPFAAFVGSAAYQLCGNVISMLNLYNIAPCVALLPWIGWAFLRCLKQVSRARIVTFGALFSLQIVLMEPLMMQCVLWLMLAIAVICLVEAPDKREAGKSLIKVVLWGTLFAIGLSAIQVLPSLELLRNSIRGKGYNSIVLSYWSMHPADLVNTIVPNLFGNTYTLRGEMYWGEKFHYAREGYFISLYLGISVVLLALFSSFSSRRALKAVFATIALISTVFALGQFGYVYLWIGKWLPVFRFGRYPIKYMLLSSLAICVLASLGIEAVRYRQIAFHRRLFPILIAVGLVVVGLCLGISVYISSHSSVIHNIISSWLTPDQLRYKNLTGIQQQLISAFRWAGLFGLISLALLFSARFWKNSLLVAGLLAFIIVAELSAQNVRLSPLISGADFAYTSEVEEYLKPTLESGLHRVYNVEPIGFLPVARFWAPNRSVAWLYLLLRRSGEPLFGIMNGVQYSISYSIDDLNTKESDEILRQGSKLEAGSFLILLGRLNATTLLTLGEMDSPKVSFCKSFYTGSDKKLMVYRLKDPAPRAYFASKVHWAGSQEKALESLLDPKFLYQGTAILEGTGQQDIQSDVTGQVRIMNYENNSVRCAVEAGGKGYLVLVDSYYPGWSATLDGSPVAIRRANYAFRAVEVPPGKHVVEFRYRPWSFYLGFLLSGLTLAIGVTVWYRKAKIS